MKEKKKLEEPKIYHTFEYIDVDELESLGRTLDSFVNYQLSVANLGHEIMTQEIADSINGTNRFFEKCVGLGIQRSMGI